MRKIIKKGFLVSKNKRGSIDLPVEEIIFIVLNLIFFVILTVFIINSTRGIPVYEQAYAKQIGMAISNAKPNMTIFIDMEEDLERFDKENPTDVISLLDDNKVVASFGSSDGRYFRYITDADVSLESTGGKFLKINVSEKNG